MPPFQGLAASVPLPISMLPYTMGGRLCRYLLLRCLPTGLCSIVSAAKLQLFSNKTKCFLQLFANRSINCYYNINNTSTMPYSNFTIFWGDAKLYITVKGY